MNPLRDKDQQIKLYETIYVHLPFEGMTHLETINIPIWRLMAEDCIVYINTQYTYADTAFALLEAWDLRYLTMRRIRRHEPNPVVIATRGNAEGRWGLDTIDWEKHGSLWGVANELGNPKLRINYRVNLMHSHMQTWDYAPPTGGKFVDPYYYPLRRNGLDIEESLVDLLVSIRQESRNQRFAEWKILEKVGILLVNGKLSLKFIKDMLRESTGVSYSTAQLYVNLIRRIQRGEYKKIPYTDKVSAHL